jgi:predicted Zn-dependent peptidase
VEPAIDWGMPERPFLHTTPHGIEILVEPLPHVRSCSVGFWVKRGSCHEGPLEEGLAHFIEHTVFKGTESYPTSEEMAAATDRLGGHLDAFTGKEAACFHGKVLREQLPDLLHILGDLVTSPRFEPEELAKERSVILEEIAQSEDTPDDWASELFYDRFWRDTPLAHSILGRPDQVDRYGAPEARSFFERTYRAPNLLVAAAGDLELESFLDLLNPILARIPEGAAERDAPLSQPAPFLLNVPRKDLQQTSLVMGFPTGGHEHEDRVAAHLLSHILGGGMSSRLFMELREKRALCYQVGSYISLYRGTGAVQITAGCATERARELVQRTVAECLRLAREGATAEELERAKLQARTTLVFGLESTGSRMFTMAHHAITLGRVPTLDELMGEIESVDLDQLNCVARRVLDPRTFGVAALGTKRGSEIRGKDLEG